MNQNEPEALKGITITHAYIQNKNRFVFIGQRYQNNDAWADSLTYIIFYNANKQDDARWIVHKLKYLTDANGVIGSWCEKPEPLWIFGYVNTGYIEKFDENGCTLLTEEIPKQSYKNIKLNSSFTRITSIGTGYIYAVRGRRTVWRRESANKWDLLNSGFPDLDYYGEDEELYSDHGFRGIAGFADNDIYACGGKGDLWHYDGNNWKQLDLPRNNKLRDICCGDDGLVYITTNVKTVIYGKKDRWNIIEQDITSETFESIAWYQDRCLINTQNTLYEVTNGVFSKSSLNDGIPNLASIIATKNNILLTTSRFSGIQNEISYYDGSRWHKILHRERPPKKPGEKSLVELMIDLEKKHK